MGSREELGATPLISGDSVHRTASARLRARLQVETRSMRRRRASGAVRVQTR
ncbi:MAG: hypothetical protein GX607_08760 [Myxococcales bacterium]|jgi:hypothetical protein|nr:hypothetical protein [Myxococcales bacterium]